MIGKSAFLILVFLALGVAEAFGSTQREAPMALYVMPFYASDGPHVNVGKFSRDLAEADHESIILVTRAMHRDRASLPIAAMYVAAIRLYDLGRRDEAVEWFYLAQYRARLFQAVLDRQRLGAIGSEGFELVQAHSAFHQLTGLHINGYAGCDRGKWIAVLEYVEVDGRAVPDLASIYPSVPFIPGNLWEVKSREISADLRSMADYLEANWDELAAARAQSDADAKFCRP